MFFFFSGVHSALLVAKDMRLLNIGQKVAILSGKIFSSKHKKYRFGGGLDCNRHCLKHIRS